MTDSNDHSPGNTPPTPDYAALFDVSPYPYLLMDTSLVIIGANRAYLRATGRAADIIGQPVFDAFPSNPDDPDSTNIEVVRSSLLQAIATKLPHNTAFLRYAVPIDTPDGKRFEERYWSTVHTPVLNAAGDVVMVAQNAIDVTGLYSFDRSAEVAAVQATLKDPETPENFNRAQMHEAMTRILNDERSHLSSLFNQAPGFIAIMSGKKHVFQMVNQAYYELVGHRELLGKPVWEALPDIAGQGFEAMLDSVFNTGNAVVARSVKASINDVDTGVPADRYMDLLCQPLFNADGTVSGIFAQGHDVTETYLAQQAQRDSEQRLQDGMLAARMVIWDLDLVSSEVRFSENAMAVFGGDWTSVSSVWESLHPEDMPRLHAARAKAIAERGSYRETVRLIRPDTGAILWLDVRGQIVCNAEGVAVSVRGVSVDITERMRAEEDLREADRRKDEFLAMLAHELRNPLAPISAAAQLLRMSALDPAIIRKTSDVISRQVAHMTRLVDDLLDVSRVTRGLIELERKRLAAQDIVADAVEQTRPVINARHHALTIAVPAERIELIGDQKRLVQVLTNLLNNAAKYTPENGRLRLSLSAEVDQVVICIEDNGIGIAPDLLPHVFDLFTQAERTPDRSQGGLGLGLALVKSLVSLHGGTITADSAGKGLGSTFRLALPRALDAEHAAATPAAKSLLPRGADGLRLLVVDDNADAAEMMGAFMEAEGHQVSIEYDPYRALERARIEAPDVCLLDIGLPGMDGNQLARCLRTLPELAHTTLIAVTGYGKQFDREQSMAAGFDHYFVKPADPGELSALLATIQARRKLA